VAQNGDKYIWGRAKDTSFNGFMFWFSPDEPDNAGDVISGEFSDPRAPLTIQGVFVEQRYVDPATIVVEPEPIQLPEAPAPVSAVSEDEWRMALSNGQYLAPIDVLQMARAVVRLEARVKQLECGKS
jgi:hypothetical protein